MSKYLETDSSIATRNAAATAAVRKTPGMMMTMMTTMIPVVTVMRMKCSSLLSDRDLTRDQNLLFSRRKRSCFGSICSIRFSPTSGPGDSFLRIRWMTPGCHGTTVTSPGTWGPWEYEAGLETKLFFVCLEPLYHPLLLVPILNKSLRCHIHFFFGWTQTNQLKSFQCVLGVV